MAQISMTKKYTTRDGRPARILAVDLPSAKYPVCCCIGQDEHFQLSAFTADGRYYHSITAQQSSDLIEVVPFKKDDRVMVRNYASSDWERRHFSHTNCEQFICFNDGRDAWGSKGHGLTSAWIECRAYDPKIDGE
jgi:hypothetical protein